MGFVDSPEKALWVALAYVGIQFLENNLLIPALMKIKLAIDEVVTTLLLNSVALFIVSALFMTLGSLNSWLITMLPADVTEGGEPPILDPLINLIQPISTHVFVIAAIFAVIALITAERESGTLAWTASKPVSRSAIWLSKFTAASIVMWITAAVLGAWLGAGVASGVPSGVADAPGESVGLGAGSAAWTSATSRGCTR